MESRDNCVDAENPPIVEAEAKELGYRPSRASAASAPSTIDPPPSAIEKRICGLRRMSFWTILAGILIIVMVAAVVGGVVDGRNRGAFTAASSSISPGGAPPNVTVLEEGQELELELELEPQVLRHSSGFGCMLTGMLPQSI